MIQSFKTARSRSTPLIFCRTFDPVATAQALAREYKDAPLVSWNAIEGLAGINDRGKEAVAIMCGEAEPSSMTSPVEALSRANKLPQQSLLLCFNLQMFFRSSNQESVALLIQAVSLLRDSFKSDRRTLVMLGTDISLPVELQQDVLVLDEPLPDDEALAKIVTALYATVPSLKKPEEKELARSVDALRGLASFPAEQVTAMSLTKDGMHLPSLWSRKYQIIDQVKGLSVDRGKEKFDTIGGLDQIKKFSQQLMNGKKPPRVTVRIEEIEKAMSGASGDLSGVSGDQLQVMLTEMEDRNYSGLIAVGHPGGGKSLYSKALANTFGIPALRLDLGAAKGSGLVGQAEAEIRAAFKCIAAMAGDGGAFFIATSNNLQVIKPELRRRFRYGTWFFDLPSAEELEAIWAINLKQYGLDAKSKRPNGGINYTGSDIRNICEIAWRMNIDLVEASQYIVPVSVSDPNGIATLQNSASGKYLSASFPGVYRVPSKDKIRAVGRAIDLN